MKYASIITSMILFLLASTAASFELSGFPRLIAPGFLMAAFSFAALAVILGEWRIKAAGAAVITLMAWAVLNTAGLGNAGLFLIASGAWFWFGVPFTIILVLAHRKLNPK
jgi:hypothetical protein